MTTGRLRSVAFAGVLVMALSAAACSSSDGGGSGGSTTSVQGGGSAALTVKDFAFDPVTLDVPSGTTTITVTNEGPATHSFTMDDGSATVDIEPGQSVSVTVNITADAMFHCRFHPQMTGTLKVG